MRYQKFQPVSELRPFVECYFVWEGEAKEPMEVQSPPNSFTAIVLNYEKPYEVFLSANKPVTAPLAFVAGLSTSNYRLVLKGKIGMVGIVFRASALHNFFGVRMSQLVNSRMELSLLLGTEAVLLWGNAKIQRRDEARIKILQDFVFAHLAEAKSRLSIIDEAVELIDQFKGCVVVEDIAAHLKISRRYLEKKFIEKVGVSPKFYARIKRFTTLSKTVAYSEKFDWQDLVFENGLHDQSHLVKEFLEFNRMSPSEYFEKHHELIRFIKPK